MCPVRGGLNHQIEHYSFLAIPRERLRMARSLTTAYCAEIGMPYQEVRCCRLLRRGRATHVADQRTIAKAWAAPVSPVALRTPGLHRGALLPNSRLARRGAPMLLIDQSISVARPATGVLDCLVRAENLQRWDS